LLPKTASSPFPPQAATALTARTLLHGPARRSCASGTSGGASSPSHGLNGLACDASLAAVAVAMAVTGMASVAAAQADVFQKNSDNKLNKIDTNMKIKR